MATRRKGEHRSTICYKNNQSGDGTARSYAEYANAIGAAPPFYVRLKTMKLIATMWYPSVDPLGAGSLTALFLAVLFWMLSDISRFQAI